MAQFSINAQRFDPYEDLKKPHQEGADYVGSTGNPGGGNELALKDFRRDLTIEAYNEAGLLAIRCKAFRCWVSEFQATSDLDANANAVLI